jgi:hypothetical protein
VLSTGGIALCLGIVGGLFIPALFPAVFLPEGGLEFPFRALITGWNYDASPSLFSFIVFDPFQDTALLFICKFFSPSLL